MNRRHFLISGGSALAMLQLVGCAAFHGGKNKQMSKEEFAVFWNAGRFEGPEILLPQQSSHIFFVDALNQTYDVFEIPITAHSMIQDEKIPENIFIFSKWYRDVGLFDRNAGKLTKHLVRPDHIRAYGHGVWDRERDGFWYTEHDHKEKKGYIVLCDRNLNIQERVPSGGAAPHEVRFNRHGDLIVANSFSVNGGMPGVATIDAKTLKLKNLTPVPELNNIGFIAHMVLSKTDDRIFVTGHHLKQEKSVVVQIDNHGKAALLDVNHNAFIGETFSIVHDGVNDHLLWTNPLSGAFFSWDLKAQKLINCDMDKFYVGLHDNGEEVLVTSKNDSGFFRKSDSLEKIVQVTPPAQGTWGVHMQTIKKRMG